MKLLKCIDSDNAEGELTCEGIYQIIGEDPHTYAVKNDKGRNAAYNKCRFKIVSDEPVMKEYKLIKKYPGSPHVGYIVQVSPSLIDSIYSDPEFWELLPEKKKEIQPRSISLSDGVTVWVGKYITSNGYEWRVEDLQALLGYKMPSINGFNIIPGTFQIGCKTFTRLDIMRVLEFHKQLNREEKTDK